MARLPLQTLFLTLMLAGGLTLFGTGVRAQDAPAAQTQNGVSFISGGVGQDDADAMRAAAGRYNLHLLFAISGSGDYLSGVHVTIRDRQGQTLVDTAADGPFFLAELKPGRYRITADNAGAAKSVTVAVPASGAARQSFYWPPAAAAR